MIAIGHYAIAHVPQPAIFDNVSLMMPLYGRPQECIR